MAPAAKVCICQICNCGRHRCPHSRKKPITTPCGISEYTNKYIPYELQPVKSCKPAHRPIEAQGPMESDTTHRKDYVSHPLDVQPSFKPERTYEPPKVHFDGVSTYTKEYIPRQIERLPPVKPPTKRMVEGKFTGEPTYKSDYVKWDLETRHPHVPEAYKPPTEPFKGVATYTTDYVPHEMSPTQSCKPSHQYIASGTPFDSISDYRDAYRQHPLERTMPIVHKDCVQKAGVPMEGLSTHMRDFDWKTGHPPASCKPINRGVHSDSPFESDTTHRTDYKEWPAGLQPTKSMSRLNAYEPPKGVMLGDTTYMRDYTPHDGSTRAQPVGPRYKRMFDLPPFQGTTDYRESYRPWTLSPRERSVGPGTTYYKSTAPFDGCSTTKQHYVPHPGCRPAESCKPHQVAAGGQGEFDDATIYRGDYTQKYLEPCPAALLNTSRSRFAYAQEDENGHLFYYKVAETTSDYAPTQDLLTTNAMTQPVAVAN
ncbi:protein FAM154A [Clonorchis sinensis]|uniref:Protein FAM154A n=1 Tax=Clonorchis sinensis TaxID=79923 RepID=H2KPC8_CLOSI|nr:protein FAM154A [Clonorchis sinensis]